MKTAMQELIEGLKARGRMYSDIRVKTAFMTAIEIAESKLSMEKEQIVKAYNNAIANSDEYYPGIPDFGEQYYNENYGTGNNL
jgi:hypothetical protein